MNWKRFKPTWKILKSRYFIVGLSALVWMLFFDQYAIVDRMEVQTRIRQLERDRDFYSTEMVKVSEEKDALFSDISELERFAREKFYMKKDNEDLFIVVEE